MRILPPDFSPFLASVTEMSPPSGTQSFPPPPAPIASRSSSAAIANLQRVSSSPLSFVRVEIPAGVIFIVPISDALSPDVDVSPPLLFFVIVPSSNSGQLGGTYT
jgi:hypothetical protein